MKNHRVTDRNHSYTKQSGVTLIVVLVILVVMTFLGLGAMSDNNVQLSMVRNSQMQNSAYVAALTEINAQLDSINANPVGADDQIIISLVQSDTAADRSRTLTVADADLDVLLDDVLGAAEYAAYTTDITLTEPNVDFDPKLAGFTAKAGGTIKFYMMQFVSTASVNNTGAESSQVQAFSYIGAK